MPSVENSQIIVGHPKVAFVEQAFGVVVAIVSSVTPDVTDGTIALVRIRLPRLAAGCGDDGNDGDDGGR